MYGILCLKDGDPSMTIPMMDEDDSMATWKTLKEARLSLVVTLCARYRKYYMWI
ncbi:hypothetical protein LCGC14_0278070 [marine sediment metagenome]|uniref:Uncharacterized protein n=1 Tax=marine sediment metagenome TaxID=412755 RepID=A0A0F9WHS5_9ZZZZ